MKLTVHSRLEYAFAEPSEVLLLIEAARTPDQAVQAETLTLTPDTPMSRIDDSATGERRVVFTGHGNLVIDYRAEVETLLRDNDLAKADATPIRDLPSDALAYLRASRYSPSDRFEAFVEREFSGLKGGACAQAIIDWIRGHLDYRAGVSTPSSTAEDTFVDRAGVCRDYAHLAIAMLRAADLPARAVSAYAWKLKPPDFHAVIEVYLGGRWRLVDVTDLAPVDGLVRIATGRDAADIAFMTIFGKAEMLNQTVEVKARR